VRAQVRALLDRHATSAVVDEIHVVERIPVDRRHNAKIDRPAVAAALAQTASDARRA
jgi:hypothetical protein